MSQNIQTKIIFNICFKSMKCHRFTMYNLVYIKIDYCFRTKNISIVLYYIGILFDVFSGFNCKFFKKHYKKEAQPLANIWKQH